MSEARPPTSDNLSANGQWRWDGQNWVPAEVSPDGRSRWDGYAWWPMPIASNEALVVAQPAPGGNPDVLQAAAVQWARHGWRVVHQGPTSLQLVRPKTFSFLWATAWFLLCGVGVLVYVFYWMSKKDEQKYLSIDEYGRLR